MNVMRRTIHGKRTVSPAICAAACLLAAGAAQAQAPTDAPPDPAVTLGDYFNDDKPVVLTLVYYRCPSICNALLNGMVYTINDMEWSVGEEFRVVTVSFDPSETHDLADAKKRNYLSHLERETAAEGWRFLVGEESSTETLTEAVGFEYRYVPLRAAHGAVHARGDPHDLHSRRKVVALHQRCDVRAGDAADGADGGIRRNDRHADGAVSAEVVLHL
jgi:cytochrome oxidase Cu insertion factor (SCO1/SenC/PrrC family)